MKISKLLKESVAVNIFREEYRKHVDTLIESMDMYYKFNGDTENVISKDLRVRRKADGTVFTVQSVSHREVVLRSPENDETFEVGQAAFEKEYELD